MNIEFLDALKIVIEGGSRNAKRPDEEEFQRGVQRAIKFKHLWSENFGMTPAERFAKEHKNNSKIDPSSKFVIDALIRDSDKHRWAFDSLVEYSSLLLKECEPLPEKLSKWLADPVNDMVKTEKKRPRPPRSSKDSSKNHFRDLSIYFAVKYVCSIGSYPTRNQATTPKRSACDAVAKAYGLEFDVVVAIWKEFK